jgi:hypothetical protein
MPVDLLEKLEQLAEIPIPPAPPPKVFDRAVHERINSRLLVGQIVEFVFRGCGFAMVHFAKAVIAAARFTITGKLETPKDGQNR